jgi:hypothetical protein
MFFFEVSLLATQRPFDPNVTCHISVVLCKTVLTAIFSQMFSPKDISFSINITGVMLALDKLIF